MRTPTITAEPAVVYVTDATHGRRSLNKRGAAMRAARALITTLSANCGCVPYNHDTHADSTYCRHHDYDRSEAAREYLMRREKRLFEWLVKRIVRKFQRTEAAAKVAMKDTVRRTVRASKARMRYGDYLRAKDSHPDLTFREFMGRGFLLKHPNDVPTLIPRGDE